MQDLLTWNPSEACLLVTDHYSWKYHMAHDSKLWNGGKNHVIIDLGQYRNLSYKNIQVPLSYVKKLQNGGKNDVIIDQGQNRSLSYKNNQVPLSYAEKPCTRTAGKAMLWKSNINKDDYRDDFDVVMPLGLNRGVPNGPNGTWIKNGFVSGI